VGTLPDAHATEGHTNMVAEASTRRTDEKLVSILSETANWIVNGVQGVVLCEVATLRLAIEKAARFDARGRDVVALIRGRPAQIVVLSGQVRKSTNLQVEAKTSPRRRVAAFTSETAGDFDGPLPALIPNGVVYREATVENAVFRK
jgi:hypothetical protein